MILRCHRRFLLKSGALGFGAAIARSPKRPNILPVRSGGRAAPHFGCYGDRVVQTLRLDRLAAEGIRFDRA